MRATARPKTIPKVKPAVPNMLFLDGSEKDRQVKKQKTIEIFYSDKYRDEMHVILPREMWHMIPRRLMKEEEWRALGIRGRGWIHYNVHRPEPHVILFRRPISDHPRREPQAEL